MNIRRAQIGELDQLAERNQQLIEDEGHSYPMSLVELRERMKAWIIGEYVAVIFSDTEDLGYALYREDKDEVYLRQFFVNEIATLAWRLIESFKIILRQRPQGMYCGFVIEGEKDRERLLCNH